MKSQHEQCKEILFSRGFTQWRHETGQNRGELSASYRNYDLGLNIILRACGFEAYPVDVSYGSEPRRDILEIVHCPELKLEEYFNELSSQVNKPNCEHFKLTQIEPENLVSMGWIQITSIGEENLYFTKDDIHYFCKDLF